ncbi:MAG: hypothetical protein HQ593_01770 [Candidatus Omnitrophica bacterium]|nr:hypothetical protein [Candidatus Omnitrophota bacterium]
MKKLLIVLLIGAGMLICQSVEAADTQTATVAADITDFLSLELLDPYVGVGDVNDDVNYGSAIDFGTIDADVLDEANGYGNRIPTALKRGSGSGKSDNGVIVKCNNSTGFAVSMKISAKHADVNYDDLVIKGHAPYNRNAGGTVGGTVTPGVDTEFTSTAVDVEVFSSGAGDNSCTPRGIALPFGYTLDPTGLPTANYTTAFTISFSVTAKP